MGAMSSQELSLSVVSRMGREVALAATPCARSRRANFRRHLRSMGLRILRRTPSSVFAFTTT